MKIAAIVIMAYSCLLSITSSAVCAAETRTMGRDVHVGSFKLHVQLQRQSIRVMEQGGSHAPEIPAATLEARFGGLNPQSRHVTIEIAVRNLGPSTLFAPLRAVVTKIASPKTTPVNPDQGTGPGTWTWLYDTSFLGGSSTLAAGQSSTAKQWVFAASSSDFQLDVKLLAGVPVPAGQGAVIRGPDGSSVIVAGGSVPYEALIDISPVPISSVAAPLGDFIAVKALKLTFQPADFNASFPPPSEPLALSFPAPASLPSTRFVVGEEILIDSLEGTPGVKEQLAAVDTASLNGNEVVTESTVFSGIFGGGLFVFVANTGSGFVTGTTSDANGTRSGIVVSNNTNRLVAVSNDQGRYTLFVNGGPYTVTGFDPLRGSTGNQSGSIAVPDSTVVSNIFLNPLAAPPITRDGIRNSGFERGSLSSWSVTGSGAVVQQLGPTSVGRSIRPTEGEWMADINTGSNSIGGTGSGLRQRFRVPAGVRSLRLDFNFVSEEFPEFVGSQFDDAFRAVITTPSGQSTFAAVSVNASGGFELIGDCFFPGGDGTCGQTGWRQGSVDLSAHAGTGTPVEVDLLFTAVDAGDNIYDTHVLVDNIRFSTLWIDANIVQGGTAGAARVQGEIREANEILSQAGIIVRLRGTENVPDPGGLLDVDATWTVECRPPCKGVPTAEENQLLALARSATASDFNFYYTRSLTGIGALAIAIGPDDFHDITTLSNSGVITTESAFLDTMAHEMGHILISPDTAGSTLEHNVGTASNIMNTPRTMPRTILNRQQSARINQSGTPLLRP